MNLTPRHRLTGPINVIYGNDEFDGIVIECEVTHPPSRQGQTGYVFVQGQDVTDLLRELRGAAIDQRAKAMPQ